MALAVDQDLLNRMVSEFMADPVAAKAAEDALLCGYGRFMVMLTEPRHQFVVYDAVRGRAVYERPDTLYLSSDSPSNSRWMVPGFGE